MAWFDWWRPAPKAWYYLAVIHPVYGRVNHGPRYLTANDAANWHVDAMEENWDSEVRRYRWEGTYWGRV